MTWIEYGGRLRRLAGGETVVGSASGAGVHLADADLLPRHFVVRVGGDEVFVRPWSADSVVALNGKQIGRDECRIGDGDIISAGSAHFQIWRAEPQLSVTDEATVNRFPTAHLVDLGQNVAYPLDRLSTNIGRAGTNVVRVKDPTASRFHAQIRREAGGFALHSVGSSGTRVNGQRVGPPQLLEEGDEIEIAYATFRYTRSSPPEGVTLVYRGEEGPAEISERPTLVRDRISIRRLGAATRGRLREPVAAAAAIALVVAIALLWRVLS